MAAEGKRSESDQRSAAIDAAVQVLTHLIGKAVDGEFFHVHVIRTGPEYRYEITKQFPKRRLKLAGPPDGAPERRIRE
jgi:hypothetical protein